MTALRFQTGGGGGGASDIPASLSVRGWGGWGGVGWRVIRESVIKLHNVGIKNVLEIYTLIYVERHALRVTLTSMV